MRTGELNLSPSSLAISVQLRGILIVGTGLENEVRDVQRRERAERAAGRLKVLSDPTRLAILFELLRTHHHAAQSPSSRAFSVFPSRQ
jgi:hypothetical protein